MNQYKQTLPLPARHFEIKGHPLIPSMPQMICISLYLLNIDSRLLL